MYLHCSFPYFLCGSAENKSIPNFISLSLYLNVNIRLPNSLNHHDFTNFLSSWKKRNIKSFPQEALYVYRY